MAYKGDAPYTTPTLIVKVKRADLTGLDVLLTLMQMRKRVEITEFESVAYDGENTTLTVTLTQEQSAEFLPNVAIEAQVNVLDSAGYRAASTIDAFTMPKQLHREVMESA